MDAPFEVGESASLIDVLADTGSEKADNGMAYTDSLRIDTERMLSLLTDTQKEVIKMYFGLGMGEPMHLEDIALKQGLTRERIRQIKDKAINRLRSLADRSVLQDYLCQ